jgi:hypothetical protein
MLLNHAQSGSVTQGYRHSIGGLSLKRVMLTEWSNHIESLLGGEADTSNVTRLA